MDNKAETHESDAEITAEEAIQPEEIKEETKDTKQPFDYRKEREERVKRRTEKAFLNEFGANSIDEIKEKLGAVDTYKNQIEELKKEVNTSKINGYKVEVLKNGFDEKFVDFIVYSLKDKVNESEDFSSVLSKFKEENSQFLRNSNTIKYSTAPNFETGSSVKDTHCRMNDFFSGKTNTI